jgi:hypothetical protein
VMLDGRQDMSKWSPESTSTSRAAPATASCAIIFSSSRSGSGDQLTWSVLADRLSKPEEDSPTALG